MSKITYLLPRSGQLPPSTGYLGCCTWDGSSGDQTQPHTWVDYPPSNLTLNVPTLPQLNLFGRTAIYYIGSLDTDVRVPIRERGVNVCPDDDVAMHALTPGSPGVTLRNGCQQLWTKFPELFKPELGCLKDLELKIKFKKGAKPALCKPRAVPLPS